MKDGLPMYAKENERIDNWEDIILDYIIECYDFEKCKEFAYDYDEYFINDEYYTWQDLKELEMAKVRDIIYKQENYKIINEELKK